MKRIACALIALLLVLTGALPALAENGQVTYEGPAGDFVFAPGSEYSLTDLFPNFKDVMPGDSLTQKITVKNDASNQVKVKIYMRSLGAHPDSVDFLSQLRLRVAVAEGNDMAYMFDAAADQTAQLTDWICLGTLYSGGVVDLDVTLDVPTTLTNEYSQQIGYLDWQFMVEEFPIEKTDPTPPKTGDASDLLPWAIALVAAAALFVVLLVFKRRKQVAEEQ